MALRRPYVIDESVYIPAPVGGWNPDGNPWELPANQAPVLDNALMRPGRITSRGPFLNWADLSAITTPAPPLNVCGVQPVPGSTKVVVGRKAASGAYIDPWFAPIVRPGFSGAIAGPTANLAVVSGGTTFTNTATAANLIPGPRGISFEGKRYFIGYGTSTSPAQDTAGVYFAQTTNLCTLNTAGTPSAVSNSPRGFIDIKGYQSRVWALAGIDDPASGTTFNPLALFYTNPGGPTGAASYADWKDPVTGLTNKIVMDGDYTDPGVGLATVRNALLILRYSSIWALRGSTTANYSLVPVSRAVGCVDPRSIVETDQGTYFLSQQGLMLTDGVVIRNVSGTVLHTLQNAISLFTSSVLSSVGGYATCAVTSAGQVVVSIGVSNSVSGAPDGHMAPVWCAMFDPGNNTWTRITSALFATDGTILVSGNNYPGQVFNTPDGRLLSIGDKYITQWEASTASSTSSVLTSTLFPTAATNDAALGVTAWTNPTNAEATDSVFATMTDSGSASAYAGTAANGSTGHPTWAPLSNAQGAPDSSSATSSQGASSGLAEQLLLSNYGFSVPGTATILGITVNVTRAASGTVTDSVIQLRKAGAATGSNRSAGASWPGSLTLASFGGAADLWGTTWTPSDINNSGFGVIVQPTMGGFATAYVDAVGITVTYRVGSQLLKVTNFGFSIPTGATINNILVTVQRKSGAGTIIDTNIQLYKAGVLQSTNKSAGAAWPTTVGGNTYGGDLWGTTWTPTDINNSGFGVGVAAAGSGASDTASMDSVSIMVTYTVTNVVQQQSFVKVPGLYDTDPAGAFQPIPFRWTTQLYPIVGTGGGQRKVVQLKRFFVDYLFQGAGLPSANGFTVKPITAAGALLSGAASVQLAPINNSMQNSSVSGGPPIPNVAIERQSVELNSEATDMAIDIQWVDAQQSTQPSSVAAEVYGIGIDALPGRPLHDAS